MVSPGTALESSSLVRAAIAGDDAAFTGLYQAYARSVFNMILRSVRDAQLAEDLSQDVWLKAHRQLGKLREPDAFPTWLYRIAAKSCIDVARRKARRIEGCPLDDNVCALVGDPELSAIERDEAQHVWEALAALPAHQHLALFLREVEHRPYQEIGQILGISETAAGLCLFRGRRSFAATYTRVHDLDAGERCMAMRRLISLQIDGQATAVQDHALNAHLNDCSGCRNDVKAMRLSSQRYAGLFLAPVPMLAHADVLSSVVQAKAAGSGVIGKLVAFLLSQGKTAAITIVLVTSAAAAPQAVQIAVDRFEQTERSSPIGGTGSSSESAPVAQAMEHESVGSDPAQSDPPILPSIATPGAELIDDAMRLVPPTDELLADPVATADELLADPVATADELLRDVAETSDAALSDVLAPLPDTDLPLASPSLSLTPFP